MSGYFLYIFEDKATKETQFWLQNLSDSQCIGRFGIKDQFFKGFKNENQHYFLDEVEILQLLGLTLQFDNNWYLKEFHPLGFKAIHGYDHSVSLNRIPISRSGLHTISTQLKCSFISPNQFYSKEVVLSLALYEAALRSNYPEVLTNLLPQYKLLGKEMFNFKTLYSTACRVDMLKNKVLEFYTKDLHKIDDLKSIVEEYSVAIKFYYFDQSNSLKSIFLVPEDPKISPIPIVKLIEYQGNYSILYTEDENIKDGFDNNGQAECSYIKEEIKDSFYFTAFQGFDETLLNSLFDIFTLIKNNDQQSRNNARKIFNDLVNSIDDKIRDSSKNSNGINSHAKNRYSALKERVEDVRWVLDASPSKTVNMGSDKPLNLPQLPGGSSNSPLFLIPSSKPEQSKDHNFDQNSKINQNLNNPVESKGYPQMIASPQAPVHSPQLPTNPTNLMNQPSQLLSPASVSPGGNPPPLTGGNPHLLGGYPPSSTGMIPQSTNLTPYSRTEMPNNQNYHLVQKTDMYGGNSSTQDYSRSTLPANNTMRASYRNIPKCPCCELQKNPKNFHDRCDICESCIVQSINDRKCLNCNKAPQSFMTKAREFRDGKFKCNGCGVKKSEVQVDPNCRCIICIHCIGKLNRHDYHKS